jgi:hypothetical protein
VRVDTLDLIISIDSVNEKGTYSVETVQVLVTGDLEDRS